MYAQCFIASFHPLVLYRIRQIDTRIVTSFLFIDNWSSHLLRNARDMRIAVPWFVRYNFPLHWLLDDLIWWFGTEPAGLNFLGASISACEIKALTENQIRKDRANGIITSTWVANHWQQKEWLLRQGVTVITDVQLGGGTSQASPRPQVL